MEDTVTVKKIKAVPAEKVIVAPLEAIPPIDERYLADALESVPIIKGDNVMVPYFGGRLVFQVIGCDCIIYRYCFSYSKDRVRYS